MKKYFLDKRGRSKIPLAKSKLFWFGVVIKLLIACFFASSFMKELFAPFADYFLTGKGDVYLHFLESNKSNAFPYPPLMLWLFSLPRLIFSPFFSIDVSTFTLADSLLYRLPLFFADFAILIVLMRWLKTKTRQILIWYWLSPVLIYINYFHGQLDVIPMALMMISLYCLFKNQTVAAYLFLGLAIACKTNMVLVLPFYVLYIVKNTEVNWKSGSLAVLVLLFTVLLINLPYLNSNGMIQMVYNNPVQRQIFDLYYQFNNSLKIYFIPAVYFVLLLFYSSFKFVNRDQLILFLAFTFLALTLMIAPMQGWYYWIFPLLVYFIIRKGGQAKIVFVFLSLFYFIYFGLIENCDYLSAFNYNNNFNEAVFLNLDEKWRNVAFTLLQTTLALAGFMVYKDGIGSNIQAKFLSQPYLLGIGGDSASGKSTLSNAMADVFESHNINIIRGDDMHKWERGNDNWTKFTHLDPKANQVHQDIEHARNLKSGRSIQRRNYDHNTGKFTLPKFIKPSKLLVFEGLHSFYLNNVSSIYDLKVFMDLDENLRMWWKVQRDVAKRGYTPEAVLMQLRQREDDSQKYIRSQISNADICASYFPTSAIDPLDQSTEPHIGLKLTLSNDFNLDLLYEWLSSCKELKVEHSYLQDKQIFVFVGKVDDVQIDYIASILLPELEEIGVYNSVWKCDYEGLMQLITTYIIFEKLKHL